MIFMIKIDYKSIGLRIKAARQQLHYTQEQVADLCDVSIQHISNIENNKTKVSLPLLIEIANVLKVTLDDLVCDTLQHSEAVYVKEINDIFETCSIDEKRLLVQSLKSTKKLLDEQKELFYSKNMS